MKRSKVLTNSLFTGLTILHLSIAGIAHFEVEFSDRNGRTYESIGLRPSQLMVLHFDKCDLTR